jgi:uncharacterized protein
VAGNIGSLVRRASTRLILFEFSWKNQYLCRPFLEPASIQCKVKPLQEFDIEFARLNNGQHLFEYRITNRFFEAFPESPVKSGDLKCDVVMDKQETMLQFDIRIKGHVDTTCDRCLNSLAYPVETENYLVVNLGSQYQEQDVDTVEIPVSSHMFSLGQYIYEYILMGLPMVVNCDGLENIVCDEQTLKYLKREEEAGGEQGEAEDPRWSGLKGLKNDKE